MSSIVVAGLGENQKIHLERTRKPEGALKEGEHKHSNKSGEIIAYRKVLKSNTIEGVTLNKVWIKEWDNKTGKSWGYSILVSNDSSSHIINLGGGMLAQSIANTLCSLINKTQDEIATMKLSFSFYQNKKGYNTCYITHGNGESLDWYMSPEEVQSFVKKAPNPLDATKTLIDSSSLHKRYMELIEALNPLLPHSAHSSGSALDELDDDDGIDSLSESDADDVFDTPATPKTTTQVQDIPFE